LECMPPKNVPRGRPSRKRLLQRNIVQDQHSASFVASAMEEPAHMANSGRIAPEPHVHGGNFFLLQQQQRRLAASDNDDRNLSGEEDNDFDEHGERSKTDTNGCIGTASSSLSGVHGAKQTVAEKSSFSAPSHCLVRMPNPPP
ncbi:MAG: hypothetical protein SGPRY_008888, partial [Prymnesium sp.]